MSEQTTFQNEHLIVDVTKKPDCIVELKVKVTPEFVKETYQSATKNVSKEVSLPGFRKGKVPSQMILKNFKNQIESEWNELTMNRAFIEAGKLTQLPLFRNEERSVQANVKSLSLEDGATIEYFYEMPPQIPTIAITELTLPNVPLQECTEKDLEKGVEELLLSKAEWKLAEARTVQLGDFVEIDIDGLGENPQNFRKNSRERVSEEHMDKKIIDALVGLTPGQSTDVTPTKEDCKACENGEEHQHDDAPFRVTLHAIHDAILPELNDEFAKKFGAENITDLREKLMKRLETSAKEQQTNAIHQQLEQQLIDKYKFDVPPSLVRQQIESHVQDMLQNPEIQQAPKGAVEGWVKDNLPALKERALQILRHYLLIQKAASDLKINVTEEEVNASWQFRTYLQTFFNQDSTPINKNTVHQELVRHKVLNAIVEALQGQT